MNELKSRIKTLSADDLIQLQKVYDIAYTVGSNFWLGIEEAINKVTPILELHKCSCGAILLISREFATNAQTDFDTNPQAKCWHLQSVSDSISSLNQNTKRLINQISVLLQEKKYNDAYILGSSILPVGSPTNFDYSLWKLQHAFIYQEYSSSEHKNNFYQFQYLKIFYDLFEAAERTNKIEYDKLISYINVPSYKSALWASIENGLTKRLEAINILNSEAYYRISYAFSPTKRIDHRDSTQLLKNYYQLIIDAYQAYFEIQENLETVFNLIRISMGQSFLEHPFDGLSIKGMKIFDKRGLMIEKILETVADTQLKAKLALAFDYRFRNNTSAHNDYILDLKRK